MKKEIMAASSAVSKEIPLQFKDEKQQKIAKMCLQLCEEWAIISGEESLRTSSKKQSKNSCKKYVNTHLDKDVVGNMFIMIILSVVIRLIIMWIIERFIVNLHNTFKN